MTGHEQERPHLPGCPLPALIASCTCPTPPPSAPVPGERPDPDLALLAAAMTPEGMLAVRDELDRLRRWIAEATEVLNGWDKVHEALGSPGLLDERKSSACLAALESLPPAPPCPYIATGDEGTSHCTLAEARPAPPSGERADGFAGYTGCPSMPCTGTLAANCAASGDCLVGLAPLHLDDTCELQRRTPPTGDGAQ